MITGVILAICAASGFGGSAVFIKLSLQKIPYSGATIMCLVVSALFSLSVAAILHFDEIIQLSPISFLWFGIVGVITFTGGGGVYSVFGSILHPLLTTIVSTLASAIVCFI